MTLPVGEIDKAISQSLKFDKFKGLAGPTPPDPSFIEEMKRIDPRLVIRFNPLQHLYMIWIHMGGQKLWGQPTHVIHDGSWGFRKPDKRDLQIIRIANHMAQKMDFRAKEAAAEKEDSIATEADKYARELALHEATQQLARKFDLTTEKMFEGDFKITRKPFSGGKHLVKGLA